ncbi:hypothetical protein EBN03_03585 [Nocardia stercoris]|uniref:Uncharacterized protein n=2 Tax=Nocardia stercoris TaxID=2483361 RepID=A0A3M2LEH4_9NOCA|nr:hypothetical protein EBN03_03585 [Nocardia stercoris]
MLAATGTAAADPAGYIPGDGRYIVGVDIAPGIYQATGSPDPTHGCDWRRLQAGSLPGDPSDPNAYIIASNYTRVTPVRVLIKPTDGAFQTTNCGSWVPSAPAPDGLWGGPSGSAGPEF